MQDTQTRAPSHLISSHLISSHLISSHLISLARWLDRRHTWAVLIMMGMLAIHISTEHSHAQQRFRATPLVRVGEFTPDPDSYGSAGINNKGQVVYGKNLGTVQAPDFRAWVWLPTGDYNLIAGVHELEGDQAIGRDINQSGDIAGQVDGVGNHTGEAAVWRLANGLTPTTLGNLGGPDPWSSAHAVTDHNPPLVAGDSGALRNCACNGTANQMVFRGFYVQVGSSIVELLPGDQTVSFTRDIVRPFQQAAFQAVGYGWCMSTDVEPFCVLNAIDLCQSYADPKFWNNSTTPDDLAKLTVNGSRAYAVNIHEASAGYAYTFGISCRRHAVYWSTPSSGPFDLHENLLDPAFSSHAEGMNNLQPPQIVGWEEQTDLVPRFWEWNGSAWSVTNLASTAAIGPSVNFMTLRQAHDINDDGWIITWGFYSIGDSQIDGRYAILLTPFTGSSTCPADMNGDGVVNVIDLLAVINAWGSCVGALCGNEDITGDAQVNVTDLLALINAWGECQLGGEEAPRSVSECEQRCANAFPGGGNDYADCVERCIRALCETGQLPVSECD